MGMSGKRYAPLAFAVTARVKPWSGSVNVAVAPGSTAPLESAMVPKTLPPFCARAVPAARQKASSRQSQRCGLQIRRGAGDGAPVLSSSIILHVRVPQLARKGIGLTRSEEHTSELQSLRH